MGLLDFFKAGITGSQAPNVETFRKLLDQIVEEARATKNDTYSTFSAYPRLDSFKSLASADREFKKQFLAFLYQEILASWKDYQKRNVWSWDSRCQHGLKLVPFLLADIDPTDEELLETARHIKQYRRAGIGSYHIPAVAIIEIFERSVRRDGLNPLLKNALKLLRVDDHVYLSGEERKQNERIIFLLQGNPNIEVSEHDRWGKLVLEYLNELDTETRSRWIRLFALSKQAEGKSIPTQKWLKEAKPILDELGHSTFSQKMKEWLCMLKEILQELHKSRSSRYDFLRDGNHEIMKGLVWCTGMVDDTSLNSALDEYAVWAYKKKPGIGPLSAKTGTAAMFAFSLLPVKEGVSRLSKFRMKVKNNTILKSINKILKILSEKNNLRMEEMEELSVPDFGITGDQYTRDFDDCIARYSLAERSVVWERGGKVQKSIPVDIKNKFGSEFTVYKKNIKEIESLLPVIKDRLEHSYLQQRKWRLSDWSAIYRLHPLGSLLARNLIWHFSKDDRKEQGMLIDESFVNVKGEPIQWLDDTVSTQLWHPIGFGPGEVLAWRNFLTDHCIVQPFKQAYREVYILTDAELRTDTYSNRFAAHVLRQHQFAALCRQRGWRYQIMGNWDSHNTPYIDFPDWNLSAQFYVNADWQEGGGTTNDLGIFNYITTDQVRFVRGGQTVQMQDVPALLLSEVMRDIDLFVGVTSIGNDPAWMDGGDNFQNTYWREYSFKELSESAKIRSQVLASLIPRLKIASQCSFDRRFLIVKGKRRTYKIHIGSGNILMEPDDQYLCIVPEGRTMSKEKVFLPFEGDGLLSIILSKAFLLAEDDKIRDKTINTQIDR